MWAVESWVGVVSGGRIWVNKEPASWLFWVFEAGMGVGAVVGGMKEPVGWLFVGE
jgi:hypothetical protein